MVLRNLESVIGLRCFYKAIRKVSDFFSNGFINTHDLLNIVGVMVRSLEDEDESFIDE
jgi:hypothetical protein